MPDDSIHLRPPVFDRPASKASSGSLSLADVPVPEELLLVSHRILDMCEGRQTGTLDRSQATQEAIMELASPRTRPAEAAA